MAEINIRGLKREIAGQYSAKFKKKLASKIIADVEKVKKQMLAEFDSHSVTQDIEAGPNASNIAGGGSLFGLIGFNSGDDPIQRLRAFLIKTLKVKINNISSKDVEFSFTVDIPTKEELDSLAPLPWAAGRSWIDEVERGVSGLGRFLVKQSPASRSGNAIQVDGQVRSSSMSGEPYITKIIANMIKNLTSTLEAK